MTERNFQKRRYSQECDVSSFLQNSVKKAKTKDTNITCNLGDYQSESFDSVQVKANDSNRHSSLLQEKAAPENNSTVLSLIEPDQQNLIENFVKDTADASDKIGQSFEEAIKDEARWPWIPLTDCHGRKYFYNAISSKSTWTIENPEEEASIIPTAFSLATAQSAWQNYWSKWKEATVENKLTPPVDMQVDMKGGSKKAIPEGISVYVEHYRTPSTQELSRPARQQVKPPDAGTVSYTQGYEEYNIWYGKHLTDRFDSNGPFGRRDDRQKATTRCNPFTDSGWTQCDLQPTLDRPIVCIFYAKGCCYLGSKCHYYHRLPTAEDDEKLDMLHDIFGRERFGSHRDDMDGVGTFSEDCRTLFVGDLKVNRVHTNVEEKTEELIQQQFGLWGPLENIKVIRNKNIAFIRYKYRVHAEFAKVAMAEQRLLLDRADDQISVRWAHPGRGNDTLSNLHVSINLRDKTEEQGASEWEMANKSMMKRLRALGYTQDDVECLIRWEIQKTERLQGTTPAATSIYPDTSTNFEAPSAVAGFVDTESCDVIKNDDDLLQLTKPESVASLDMYKMQAVLSKIEKQFEEDSYTVEI